MSTHTISGMTNAGVKYYVGKSAKLFSDSLL